MDSNSRIGMVTFHPHGSVQRTYAHHCYHRVRRLFRLPVVHAQEAQLTMPGPMKMSPNVNENTKTHVSDKEIEEYLEQETGMDRLNRLFKKDLLGKPHPTTELVFGVSQQTGLLSFIIMSYLGGRASRENFLEKNRATAWSTKFRAARAHTDAIFLGGMKTGFKWALKVGFFTFSFMSVSQGISTYRNKSSFIEYSAAGAITGAILRLNLGFRGFVAGGIIGASMGTAGGLILLAFLKLMNETEEQRHHWWVHRQLQEEKFYKAASFQGVEDQSPESNG